MNRFGLFCLCISMLLFSCRENKEIKFDKNKWRQKDDPAFVSTYRKKMLEDLMENYKLKNVKYSELVDLLGGPDFRDNNSVSYKIEEDFGRDIDPIYTKDLVFDLIDSVVVSFRIEEWKK